MKNQYVADVNDYRKYGLIRSLVDESDFRIGIFWMLTPNDDRNDGQFLTYLQQPERWRHCDELLFDGLHDIVHKHRNRSIALIKESKILPRASFVENLLPDDVWKRQELASLVLKKFSKCDLIFFDPDNGLEIASRPLGRRNSNKYLYFDEVASAFQLGSSLLIYQHFPRVNREQYIEFRKEQLLGVAEGATVCTFRTSYVCFFLVSQPEHVKFFEQRQRVVKERWDNQFSFGQTG